MTTKVQVVIDCADPAKLAPFWRDALRYKLQDPPAGFASWEDFLRANDVPESEWNSASAGLLVMRLVDAWIEDGPRVVAADSWGTRSIRKLLDELDERTKLRSILSSVIDVLEVSTTVDMGVLAPRLMAIE